MGSLESVIEKSSEQEKSESGINLLDLCGSEELAKANSDKVAETSEKLEKDPSVSRDIAAKPEDVWKLIGQFDALPWHPGIQSGRVETKNCVTTRTLVAQGGDPVFTEQLLDKGKNFLTYKMVGGLPLQPVGTLRVEPNDQGGSRVVWEAKIDGSNADKKTTEAVTAGVLGFYAAGLDNLKKKLEKSK